jgi:site-specific recombinase XerD
MNALARRTPDDPHQALIQIVLDGLESPHTKRAYKRALTAFLDWHADQGRPRLSRAVVQRYVNDLRAGGTSPASINQRLAAIRKLAAEAAANGSMSDAELGALQIVKGAKQKGRRAGNWLSAEQATALIKAPDAGTLRGKRDRAALALMLGCGLRRDELARLTLEQIQLREGRWAIVDLKGKGGRIRSVPMPTWAKQAADEWATAAGITDGRLLRAIQGERVGRGITPQAVRNIVKEYVGAIGVPELAPHDLRRTFARLAFLGGATLEQIKESLGHSSVQTTERYIGSMQDFKDAPADRLGITL